MSTESLKEKYAPYFKIGTAINFFDLEAPGKAELIKTHFNSITCANAMKYISLTKEPGVYRFEPADRIVDFVKEHDMALHGHTFVWHNQTPDYIFENATGESLLETLREHVRTFRGHFGQLDSFDAVNEAIEDKSDKFMRDTKWYRTLGEGYLTKVFRVIHEEMPDAKLFYNDYNEAFPEKRDKILRLLKEMQEEGAPIYGMGLQTHVRIYGPDFDDIKRAIEAYAALGLRLRISELDVSLYDFPSEDQKEIVNPDAELLKKQAAYYKELFRIYRSYADHIDAVTFWGLSDDDSWLNNFPVRGRMDHPLLFDRKGKPKEAFYSVMDF